MFITVLGSGVSAGFPGWNDGGERALRARELDPGLPRREGAALAVSADGERYSLLEAPLHLPGTISRFEKLAPSLGSRALPLDSIVLASADLDACAGLLGLRASLSFRVCSSNPLRAALLDHDAAFRTLDAVWSGFPWDRPIPLDRAGLLEARLFPLPGPVPDHLRPGLLDPLVEDDSARRKSAAQAGRGRAGIRITDRRTGTRLVWAPRIARFDSATLAELRSADLRFIDGTHATIEEARVAHPGVRDPGEIGHVPIEGRDGSLVWLSGMSGRTIYTHFAGSNPAVEEKSALAERIRGAGVELALDGMEIEV